MGKVITIHLIDGTPQGVKHLFISNKICQGISIPRSKISSLKNEGILSRPSLYFLIGEDERGYIGETENFLERIRDHEYKKDFWNSVLVFTSKDTHLTKADVKFLEYLSIKKAQKINVAVLDENKQNPKSPNLPDYQKDIVKDFFGDVKLLTSFVGISWFEEIDKEREHLFFCKNNRGADAKGFYNEKGFTVLEDSKIARNTVKSFKESKTRKEKLKNFGQEKENYFVLTKNLIFKSPSGASDFCLGNSSNGWNEWKDKQNKTLSEVFRGF